MAEIITDAHPVETIYIDQDTGIKFVEDRLGRWHLLTPQATVEGDLGTPLTLQASVSAPWVSDSDFNVIPGMSYTVVSGKTLSLDYIVAVSDKEANNIVGIYINNTLQSSLPFGNSLNFNYPVPPNYVSGTKVELRFKPPVKKTKLTITMGGRLKSS